MTYLRLNEKAFTPLYLQVEATLQDMIEGVKYSPGDQIPSERELSELLGISRMTARRAIENLISRGLLERRSTQGTFVRQPEVLRMVGNDYSQGLTQILQSAGSQPGSRLLRFEIIPSPQKIAEKLDLWIGEMVIVIRRLRLVNKAPFCIETSYLPQKIVPGLSADDFSFENSSLYTILHERYGIILTSNDETLKVSYATSEEAAYLGIKCGSPILLMRSVLMDEQGRHIEYVKSVNHPERVIFHSSTKLISL
jgi:GntR family transcriptional regulator